MLSLIGASTIGELSASIQDSLDVKGQPIPLVLLAEAPVSVGTSFGSILKTDAPKATTVLDLSELKTAVALTEALEFAPGVDIRSRGPWGIKVTSAFVGVPLSKRHCWSMVSVGALHTQDIT